MGNESHVNLNLNVLQDQSRIPQGSNFLSHIWLTVNCFLHSTAVCFCYSVSMPLESTTGSVCTVQHHRICHWVRPAKYVLFVLGMMMVKKKKKKRLSSNQVSWVRDWGQRVFWPMEVVGTFWSVLERPRQKQGLVDGSHDLGRQKATTKTPGSSTGPPYNRANTNSYD